MNKLDIQPNTPEWLEARKAYFCASEAPAMMNASKYQTRTQLLDAKKGVIVEVDAHTQKIFDQGHAAEDKARNIIEMKYLSDFPAVVCTKEVEGLLMLASLDGHSSGGLNFEHKLWNKTLAENVKNKILEPHYYWQLEHQMLVAETDNTIFVCSDGTREKMVSMMYVSRPERRKQLIAGWKQFAIDLESHEVKAKVEQVTGEAKALPVVTAAVNGGQVTTNIGIVLESVRSLAEAEIKKKADSDQDFANKDKLAKSAKAARAELKKRAEEIKGEFVSFSEFSGLVDDLDSALQKLQSDCERQAKQGKEAKKQAIINDANSKYNQFIEDQNKLVVPIQLGSVAAYMDFAGAMKGKRSIESCQNAVDSMLALAKIEVSQLAAKIAENLNWHAENCAEHQFLFNDMTMIVNNEAHVFQAMSKQRIADYADANAKKKADDEARQEQKPPKAMIEVQITDELIPPAEPAPVNEPDKRGIENLMELCDLTREQADDVIEQIALGNIHGLVYVG